MRKDIVKLLNNYCSDLGWFFSYGNKANQNLLQSTYDNNLENNQIYFLLDPVRRISSFGEFGGVGRKTYRGNFLLVVQSDIDMTYYNQTNQEEFLNRFNSKDNPVIVESCPDTVKGKYEENIRPIIEDQLPKIENLINCSDYRIDSWEYIDATDVFDANTDGITVSFSISVL